MGMASDSQAKVKHLQPYHDNNYLPEIKGVIDTAGAMDRIRPLLKVIWYQASGHVTPSTGGTLPYGEVGRLYTLQYLPT
jgi:hypothetical protein